MGRAARQLFVAIFASLFCAAACRRSSTSMSASHRRTGTTFLTPPGATAIRRGPRAAAGTVTSHARIGPKAGGGYFTAPPRRLGRRRRRLALGGRARISAITRRPSHILALACAGRARARARARARSARAPRLPRPRAERPRPAVAAHVCSAVRRGEHPSLRLPGSSAKKRGGLRGQAAQRRCRGAPTAPASSCGQAHHDVAALRRIARLGRVRLQLPRRGGRERRVGQPPTVSISSNGSSKQGSSCARAVATSSTKTTRIFLRVFETAIVNSQEPPRKANVRGAWVKRFGPHLSRAVPSGRPLDVRPMADKPALGNTPVEVNDEGSVTVTNLGGARPPGHERASG